MIATVASAPGETPESRVRASRRQKPATRSNPGEGDAIGYAPTALVMRWNLRK